MIERLNAALSGRYRIESELGAGGMATVYLAADLKHDRQIALKVLRPELAAVIGGERFLAEIRTTANLQHPHILPLFDSGQDDGLLWYAMPYVEGESLRDRIDRAGQLPVDDVIDLGVAVASALDYAHRQGVVHRDIKPANILLQDGQPVVADFGIALAVSNAGGGRMTETGLSLGTPFYMSPEQASADRELTAQADQYSLGCVLYECLTGQPPFMGKSAQAVLMQILTDEPKSVTTFRKSVPANVRAAIGTALEKLPADRFRTAADLAGALRNPGYGADTRGIVASGAGGRSPRGPGRFGWPAVVLLLLVLAFLGWRRPSAPPVPEPLRLEIGLAAPMYESLESPMHMAIRPDGRALAYLGLGDGGFQNVYFQEFERFDADMLYEGQVTSMAFSPTGEELLLIEGQRLIVLPIGGSLRVLQNRISPGGATWAADGTIFYTDAQRRLVRQEGTTGDPEVVYEPAEGEGYLSVAQPIGDGRHALAAWIPTQAGTIGQTVVLDMDTGEIVRRFDIVRGYLVDGNIMVWAANESVHAQRFDVAALELVGSPVQTGDTPDTRYNVFFVSDAGPLVYSQPTEVSENILQVSRSGVREEVPWTANTNLGLRLSPDGSRLVFEEGFLYGGPDIHVLDLETGVKTRLTYTADAVYPEWHPDGERVVYYRAVDGEYALYERSADGSGTEQRYFDVPGLNEVEVAFVPGSDRIVVRGGDRSGLAQTALWSYPADDPTAGVQIDAGPGVPVSPAVSPDGRFVAFGSDATGRWEVYVRSLDNPQERWQVSTDGGAEPQWHPEGTELYYRQGRNLMRVPVDLSTTWRVTGPHSALFGVRGTLSNNNHAAYDVAPDGESFFFTRSGDGRTRIVLNWLDEVKRLLEAQEQ